MFGSGLVKFNPKNIANLKLWLDAANPSNNGTWPSDNTTLSTWTDVSGTGNNASAFSTPKFKVNIKNGLPGIFFNGGQGYNISQTTSLDCTSGVSLFIVYQLTVSSTVILTQKTPDGASYGWQTATVPSVPQIQWVGGGGNTQYAGSTFSLSTVYLGGWNISSTNVNIYQNGVNLGNFAENFLPSATNATFYIGNNQNSSLFLTGYIHEILLYNFSMSAGQMALVNDYLRRKWAIY